jgi:hypothetical protein
MATGSGLDAQVGYKAETTWGTAVTVDKFVEFNSESISREPTFLEPTGLRVGTKYKRAARVKVSRSTVSGDLAFELATKGMMTLIKHMLGSSVTAPTQIGTTTAYKANFTPGDFRSLGLTIQVGRPEPSSGTVQPFTYAGCKIPQWAFSVTDGEVPTLTLTVDGKSEDTAAALATAAFTAGASVFDFSQATMQLGGTPSTTSGETTISSGTTVATIVREFSVTGAAPMATERFGIGNAGLKSEPLENDTPTITGSLGAEFNKAELYDLFTNNTTTALQFTLEGDAIGTSGENFTFDIICPAIKLKTAAPTVDGPDIVQMSTDFEAYTHADGTHPVIQIQVKTDETTL